MSRVKATYSGMTPVYTPQQLESWMLQALELAQEAASRDEVPVGALIIKNGEVLASASNTREAYHSVLGHAEVSAIEQASQKLKSWRLIDCTLITTLEPCVMCAGAIIQARVDHVVYGAHDPKGGAQTLFNMFSSPALNHRVQVTPGLMEQPCSDLLKTFFKNKRRGLRADDLTETEAE